MTVEKQLSPPAFDSRRVHLSGRTLAGRDSLLVNCRYLKAEGDALVLAEGTEFKFDLPVGTRRLFHTGQDGYFYAYAGSTLYRVGNGSSEVIFSNSTLSDVVRHMNSGGGIQTYAVCGNYVYQLGNDATAISAPAGGDCGAVYRDRLFTAKNYRVSYSRALDVRNSVGGVQGHGYIDLPHEGGRIRRMVAFDDKLFLFREYGISYLRVHGDNLTFKAGTISYSYGRLIERSLAVCGDCIAFLTESGFFRFDGTVCERIPLGADINLSLPMEGAGFEGTYYAAVILNSDMRALFVYDFKEKSTHLLPREATAVMASCGVYFVDAYKLYALTRRGVPQGECAVLETELSLLELADGNKYLDAVVVEGEGHFTVEARSESGRAEEAQGAAGHRLAFRYPVRGNAFAFRIRSYSPNVRICGLTLYVRQEKKYGY
ncbi:MAG: hypothetical protein K2L87_00075 [Clostridiales bacterium]|nr:hypothetical protein [Clostridiales bacterium]